MFGHIQKTPQALADLDDISSFIGEDNPDAAKRFLNASEAAFDLFVF